MDRQCAGRAGQANGASYGKPGTKGTTFAALGGLQSAVLARPEGVCDNKAMNIIDLFASELDRETARSRRALESVPDGKGAWKPHDKSMAFEYLASMVATIPIWITMMLRDDQFDVAPIGGSSQAWPTPKTSAELVAALDKASAGAKAALRETSEARLQTPWRLLAAGKVVDERPRHEMIRDAINHWAHHRGQMTVYLRLLGAKVPALYGPSADDQRYA